MKNLESAVEESNGTSLQGYVDAAYHEIVDALGQPNCPVDEHKVDVEWAFKLGDTVFTIYNWKNGYNYCGESGTAVEAMNHWHVGGFSGDAEISALEAVKNCVDGEYLPSHHMTALEMQDRLAKAIIEDDKETKRECYGFLTENEVLEVFRILEELGYT